MSKKLSEHELFAWVGNHGYDLERPGYPQAMALDLKIMLDMMQAERDCLLRGIQEWDLADAPRDRVTAFLEAAARGEFLAP